MTDAPARLTAALSDRYRLERELGHGGMATVYLAHDLKHGRAVAIKVLRPELAAVIGAERFLAEIKTTANLQHPHILSLFDSGDAGGLVYYVMPYVEGESLRDRLEREKQLPIDEAVRIAREVADALEYAHSHGIVHRDIKPENILLHGGHAQVADFGIALAASRSEGSTRMTETGMSLGTPIYMAPEQAMGDREITPRADVYALGVVLYEMLTGDPPFTGSTPQAVVARVLTERPRPMIPQRHTIPGYVEAAVLTALEKLPADRFATAAEFSKALGDRTFATVATRAAGPAGKSFPQRTALVPLFIAALFLIPIAFFVGARWWHPGLPPIAGFGHTTKITWDRGVEIQPAISPDGKYVAYAGGTARKTRIFVRAVAGGRPIILTGGADAAESDPTWSPDGARLLFIANGAVESAPATGGAPRPEVPAPTTGPAITDASWSPDGATIAYVQGDSIFMVTSSAEPRLLAQANDPGLCRWSPHGDLLACMTGNSVAMSAGVNFGNLSPSQIIVIRVATGVSITVTDNKSPNQSPVWSLDGRWLYFVSGQDGPNDIYALRLARDGAPDGAPIRLTTGLGAQAITLSPDGSRIGYSAFTSASNIYSVPWPTGRPRTAREATAFTAGQNTIDVFRVSPDGRWMFLSTDASGNSEIYRMPIGGGEMEQLTSTRVDNFGPDLSPDGKELAFHSWRGGSRDIYVMPMNGGATEQITHSPEQEFLASWAPDGRSIVFCRYSPTGGVFLIKRDAAGKWGTPAMLRPNGAFPTFSPDGKTISFSDDFLKGSLFTMAATGGTAHLVFQTSEDLQTIEDPIWSADGRSILFKSHDRSGADGGIYSVPATGGAARLLLKLDDPELPSMGPFWTASRSTIYFLSEEFRSDIVVMETLRR